MKKMFFAIVALAFVACHNNETENLIVDEGAYAFKQSEQLIELSLETESVRIELIYTELPDDSQYGWITLKYDAEKSTPNIERYIILPPAYAKWEVAEDGTLYYDIYLNNAEIKSDIYLYLYVMFGNEAYTEYNREMLLHIDAPENYAESFIIAKITDGCKEFDCDTVAANIVGEWELNSFVVYNEGWSYISLPYIVNGKHYVEGLGKELFTFTADGKGTNYENNVDPEIGPQIYNYEWVYDAESCLLTLTGEYNLEWTITGLNDEYMILDRADWDGDNIRTILKRK